MQTLNVKTATRESAEQFKVDERQRYCVTDGDERLDFIPALFFTPSADNMIASCYVSIQIIMVAFGVTGLFRRALVETWHRTVSDSPQHKPDISHRKVNSDITW